MSDTITPALTPEEWDEAIKALAWRRREGIVSAAAQDGRLHAAAALCLYGQRFGFTQEDAEAVMVCAKASQNTGLDSATFLRAEGVSRKLAALLPPPESPT